MNRKITIRIVLIIITFLILSSSLFAPLYGLRVGVDKLLAEISRAFMIGYLILIAILLGINYGLRKKPEPMLIVNILILLVLICMINAIGLPISDIGMGYITFGIPIIITIAGINLSLRKYKPITRIIANIVIFSFIIILIMFMPDRHGENVIGIIRESISESIRYKPINNLIEAAKNNDTNRINSILNKGKVDINAKNKDGETALMLASSEGHLEMVKLLVENGADYTNALRLASREGHLEIVKLLIENGANINAKDNDGETALMRASYNGHLEVVKYLIENGADVNIKDNYYGITALDFARDEEIKEVLRKAGAK